MPAISSATDSRVPLNFRHLESVKLKLEAFRKEDGALELTPILREAVDFYIAVRNRRGREAVRAELDGAQ
jgi:hypothetical protein